MPENQSLVEAPASSRDTPATAYYTIDTSVAVQEIVSSKPGFIVRHGTTVIFCILLLIVCCMCFIQYPDVLEGKAVVTTNPLPIRLKTNTSSGITAIFVRDKEAVIQGTPIAELRSNIDYKSILALSALSDSVQHFLRNGNDAGLDDLLQQPLYSLGDAQIVYNQLLQRVNAYVLQSREDVYARRVQNLREQVGRYKSMETVATVQDRLSAESLQQAGRELTANEALYRNKVISKEDYLDKEGRLIEKSSSLQRQYKDMIQQSIIAGESKRQLLDLQSEKVEKLRTSRLNIEESVRNLQNFIQSWKLQYLITAPYDGTVHFLRMIALNEQIEPGEELFAVTPKHFTYLARVAMPPSGLGKIRIGQKAHLLLVQFPYNEFGFLEGEVSQVNSMQTKTTAADGDKSSYQVIIKLPDTLITSFHKTLPYAPEMIAEARIITRERNLAQRLVSVFDQLQK